MDSRQGSVPAASIPMVQSPLGYSRRPLSPLQDPLAPATAAQTRISQGVVVVDALQARPTTRRSSSNKAWGIVVGRWGQGEFIERIQTRAESLRHHITRTVQSCGQWMWRNKAALEILLLAMLSHWTNTFGLNYWTLRKPIGRVIRQYSCEDCIDGPMQQPEPGTCVAVACTLGVFGAHRFEYKRHGPRAVFPYRVLEPHELVQACKEAGIWTPCDGAYVGHVLDLIRDKTGGVPAMRTDDGTGRLVLLPLRDWEEHTLWDKDRDQVEALLHGDGPRIVVLWTCPWYNYFDESIVYRGTGRNAGHREESKRLYGNDAAWHAVLSLGYQVCDDGQMQVPVVDGQRRLVDVDELCCVYKLTVDPSDIHDAA